MVEGPGATRNGLKAQVAIGAYILSVQWDSSCLIGGSNFPFLTTKDSNGFRLSEVFTIGKELFLIFSKEIHCDDLSDSTSPPTTDIAMRLHFGMNGTLAVSRNGKEPKVPKWREKESYSLRINLGHVSTNNGDTTHQTSIKDTFASIVDLTDDDNQKADNSNNEHCKGTNSNEGRTTPMHTSIKFIIEVRRSTISFSTTPRSARMKYQRLADHDVCGPYFSKDAVFQTLFSHRHQNKQPKNISDAILDQALFPGVGNIIKVESLHRAQIDPRRFLSSLSEDELHSLIQHCRDFSMYWLKRGRTPIKLVYNKTVCGTCHNASVKMQKIGGDIGISGDRKGLTRVTFWCSICQPSSRVRNHVPFSQLQNNPSSNISIEQNHMQIISNPQKNSQSSPPNQNPTLHAVSASDLSKSNSSLSYSKSNIINPYTKKSPSTNISSCQKSPSLQNNTSVVPKTATTTIPVTKAQITNPYKKRTSTVSSNQLNHDMNDNNISSILSSQTSSTAIINPYKRMKSNTCPTQTTTSTTHVIRNPYAKPKNKVRSTGTSSSPTKDAESTCPQHGSSFVILRRVRKNESDNKLRIFYTCTKHNCPFFAWADLHFPFCHCLKKKKAILRVSKTQRSGGKWFLCCAHGNNASLNSGVKEQDYSGSGGCGYFDWAKKCHLDPIQNLLTPLL